jgi:uncharacterized damage-inducible protein DinB
MQMLRHVAFAASFAILAALSLSLAPSVQAQEGEMPAGVMGEMLMSIKDAESKLIELAEATPEDKYTWRPGEGVRSQAEVFLHVAAVNYGLPSFWGINPPEGFAFQGYEQSLTSKADIESALKDSFARMQKDFMGLTEEDLDKEIDLFGNKTTVRGGYMVILSHAHEHLGQSIAYARSNGIVPPWSARQQQTQEEEGGE